MDEKILIKRIIAGDQNAFRILYEENRKKVINICYRFTEDIDIAEDITQDVFVEIFRSIKKFKKKSKISTWIYRVAVSRSIDYIRAQKSKKRSGIIINIDDKMSSIKDIKGDIKNPSVKFEEKENKKFLDMAMDMIPESQKVALTLNRYEELSYVEIAEIMGTTVSAIDSLISRGKKNLRKKLKKIFDKNKKSI